jgi:hypothetical protein
MGLADGQAGKAISVPFRMRRRMRMRMMTKRRRKGGRERINSKQGERAYAEQGKIDTASACATNSQYKHVTALQYCMVVSMSIPMSMSTTTEPIASATRID